jgi:fructose/tagatose bisphosphate aldolase
VLFPVEFEAEKDSSHSYLVFHGGSGSTKDEIKTAVNNGVVKMNVDTGMHKISQDVFLLIVLVRRYPVCIPLRNS